MEPIIINHETFADHVENHNGIAIVDFWATWCAPCRMMSPIMDELAKEAPDDVLIAKVNVDQEQQLAQEHRVMSIPTLIIYKDGKELDRIVGVTSKDRLTSYYKKGE
ncbi:MAG: thioredoxin [Tissierellia bacterium]|jgi:thioredoxin 1|nr:thioredoxin [Bacillota bacterium]NLK58938.1 thioredoxin [Tissierellia bacterium]